MEEHGRNRRGSPWAVRQVGVYSQHVADQGCWNIIILYPEAIKSLKKRLEDIASYNSAFPGYLDTHALILGTIARRWQPYISWLEQEMHSMVRQAIKVYSH